MPTAVDDDIDKFMQERHSQAAPASGAPDDIDAFMASRSGEKASAAPRTPSVPASVAAAGPATGIGAAPMPIMDRIKRVIGMGAPEGSVVANLTGQTGTRGTPQLITPEAAMTETEQEKHPILTGAAEFAGGMTSPDNFLILGLTGGAGQLAGPGAQVAKRMLAAGFSLPMLYSAAQQVPGISDAFRRNDYSTALRLLTKAGLTAGAAGLAAHGMGEEGAPLTAPRGTVSQPLARDTAMDRADTVAPINAQAQTGLENVDTAVAQAPVTKAAAKAARIMPEVNANAAARTGTARLAAAEQGVEAAKQARINAPVQIPPTTEAPTVLSGRPAGPETNPLEAEAAQVRDQQAARQAKNQDNLTVTDKRRVQPAPGELEGHIGPKGEQLAPESPETLKAQTDALAKGTNKTVYFPKGTESVPPPPENAKVTIVPGDQPGAGTWYHTEDVKPLAILKAVQNGTFGELLGNHQSKTEAISGAAPAAVVARDNRGTEVKASLVDTAKPEIVAAQAATLQRQFPKAKIGVEPAERVVGERLGAPSKVPGKSPQAGVSRETPAPPADVAPRVAAIAPEFRDLATKVQHIDAPLAKDLQGIASGELHSPEHLKAIAERVSDANTKAELTKAAEDYRAATTADRDATRGKAPKSAPGSVLAVHGQTEALRQAKNKAGGELAPEVREEAAHEIRAASELASTFERPGRYFAGQGQTDEMIPQRSQSSAKGVHAGGVWYGIGSSKHIVADQFPWIANIKQGAGKLAELAEKGKGAEYERLVATVAEHIQREKESAAPVIAEFAPKLKSLSDEIDGRDAELSETLAQLANGDGRGFKNLRQYIEEKVSNAEQARDFYRLVDAAAVEARQASVAEPADRSNELRDEEGSEPAEGTETHATEGPAADSEFLQAQSVKSKTPTEKQHALPGFESAIEEQNTGAERVRGEKLSEQAKQPLGNIDEAAGEMERKSPLFRGTEASKQKEIFGRPSELGEAGKLFSGEGLGLHVTKFPSGKYGFVGNVPGDLAFTLENGESPSPEAVDEIRKASVRKYALDAHGAKTRTFDTESAAISFARGKGYDVRQSSGEKHAAVGDSISVSNGALKGKTVEITKVGDTGVYVRTAEEGPIKFVKNGDFEAAASKSAAPEVRNLIDGTRYSGLDPRLLKFLIPESIREKIGSEATKVRQSRDLQGGLYDLDSQGAADMIRARDLLRDAPGSPKDMEQIYHHLEDPTVKLTPEQQKILKSHIQPLIDAANTAFEKLREGGVPSDNYVHRIAADKGSTLDKILGGDGRLSAGNPLSKTAPGLKGRTMMAVEDEAGNRKVVSIKGGTVSTFENSGKMQEMGKLRTPPNPGVDEYYDKHVMEKLEQLAADLGISHERLAKPGVGRGNLQGAMGVSLTGKNAIKTLAGTPEQVILHEIGHQLDDRFGLQAKFVKGENSAELRKLADLRYEGQETSDYYKKYVRKGSEKIAVMFEAYLHAPEKFKEVAPNTYKKFTEFLGAHEETKPILAIKPSMVVDMRNIGGKERIPGTFLDKNGKRWTISQATTKEIEAATPVRYYKNALASTVLNYLQMRRAERAYDFLEDYKNSPDFQQVAAKMDARNIPAGWKTTDLPQFRGYAFEPHTAEVLDWYAKRMKGGNSAGLYDQVGRFLRDAIFFNPLVHIPNIGVHWTVEKGVTGAGPQNWGRILRTGSRAIDAVIHQNHDFLDALDEGAPLQSQRLDSDAATKLIMQRMGKELEANQGYAGKIASALGYVNPLKLVRAVYDFSSKATWVSNDIAMLQATYEHMERTGQDFKTAISDVAKHIPDYRLPTRIFDSKAIGTLMSNPKLTMFGAYHYGALRSYGEMFKSLVDDSVPKSEQLRSIDRLAMLGLVTFVAYPALDKLAKLLTGDKTAEFRRAGASTFIYNLAQLARGQKTPTEVAESVATPSPQLKAVAELGLNRDLRTGKHIYDPEAKAGVIAKQVGRYGAQAIAPIGQAMQVGEKRKTIGQQAAGLIGIRTNVPSRAVTIARRYASDAAGTSAPDAASLERQNLRNQYEDKLRNKSITRHDLAVDRAAGKLTAQDQKIILQRAARTPLQNAFRNLDPEKALKVWDAATPDEQKQIRLLLANKLSGLAKIDPEKRHEIKGQIMAALHPQAAAAKTGAPMRAPGSVRQ